MGLWGNRAERITDALCKNLLGNLLNLSKLPLQVTTPKLPLNLPMDSVPLVGGLGGLGKNSQTTESVKQVLQITKNPSNSNSRGGGGGLGSLFGRL